MSSLEFLDANMKRICGMYFKSHMRELMMLRELGSMPWYKNMSCSRCNKVNQLRNFKRGLNTLSTTI